MLYGSGRKSGLPLPNKSTKLCGHSTTTEVRWRRILSIEPTDWANRAIGWSLFDWLICCGGGVNLSDNYFDR